LIGRAREDILLSEEDEPSISEVVDSGREADDGGDEGIVVLSAHDSRESGRSKLSFA